MQGKAMSEALLPDLPIELQTLAVGLYPIPELARRALLAIWPLQGFRSAYDDRTLWSPDAQKDSKLSARRQLFEKNLSEEGAPFQSIEQPYFVAKYTSGSLRSPYPELSDAEFWLYVNLYGSEQAARQSLEGKKIPSLDWKTTLEYLRQSLNPGIWDSLVRRVRNKKAHDPRLIAWSAQTDLLYPSYS